MNALSRAASPTAVETELLAFPTFAQAPPRGLFLKSGGAKNTNIIQGFSTLL